MKLTTEEQVNLIQKIENQVNALGDDIAMDLDPVRDVAIENIEHALAVLRNSFYDENTYVKTVDVETGVAGYKYFLEGDIGALCYYAAKLYCFNDIDDSYRIEEIVCGGEAIFYRGWQPGMLFEFYDCNGTIVYSAEFPHWEH
jgi:hypothetical protein